MRYPEDLRVMQGHWISVESGAECSVHVVGYTIRLKYESQDKEIQYKRNARIKKIDQLKHQMEIFGGQEPWFYVVERVGERMNMEVRFYDEVRRVWLHSNLEQPIQTT